MEQARYQEIAIDIAHAIVLGEYREGEKIRGRSTLAGRFNVSPETIRRAIAILQNVGVVSAEQGIGVWVNSRALAEKFLRSFDQKSEIQVIQRDLRDLLELRRELDQKIEMSLNKMIGYAERMLSRWLDVGEITVEEGSEALDQTIGDLKIRENTGVTVVAVVRDGCENFSPPARYVLKAGDTLLVVGSEEGQLALQALLGARGGSDTVSGD
ncbi:MAG: GntR family transcriptional regulator [Peptococcaceae bacterium]|nr:GntR family transcriptional regulator [Peptococcaceae bacterium]